MKRGIGCKVGALSVRRAEITVSFQGISLDVIYSLIDPDAKTTLGMTRKTRNWSPIVREKLQEFLDTLEMEGVRIVFDEPADENETSIADHIGKGGL